MPAQTDWIAHTSASISNILVLYFVYSFTVTVFPKSFPLTFSNILKGWRNPKGLIVLLVTLSGYNNKTLTTSNLQKSLFWLVPPEGESL